MLRYVTMVTPPRDRGRVDSTQLFRAMAPGVGLPDGEDFAQNGGLGSSLVAALANQLEARVEATNANPGTLISIVHP